MAWWKFLSSFFPIFFLSTSTTFSRAGQCKINEWNIDRESPTWLVRVTLKHSHKINDEEIVMKPPLQWPDLDQGTAWLWEISTRHREWETIPPKLILIYFTFSSSSPQLIFRSHFFPFSFKFRLSTAVGGVAGWQSPACNYTVHAKTGRATVAIHLASISKEKQQEMVDDDIDFIFISIKKVKYISARGHEKNNNVNGTLTYFWLVFLPFCCRRKFFSSFPQFKEIMWWKKATTTKSLTKNCSALMELRIFKRLFINYM